MRGGLATRLATAGVGIPVTVWALWQGGLLWAALVALVVLLSLHELHGLASRALPAAPAKDAFLGGGLVMVAAAYLSAGSAAAGGLGGVAAVGVAAAGVTAYSLVREAFRPAARPLLLAGSTVLAAVYVGGFLSHLILLREWPEGGRLYLLLAVAGTWATDTGAYMAGRAVGGRRLAPRISPNKTVAGAVGGVLASAGFLAVAGASLNEVGALRGLLLAAVIAPAAMVGDLVESAIKREAGAKDSGRLLPGHGGVLDRFDSLMFVAPAVYYLLRALA